MLIPKTYNLLPQIEEGEKEEISLDRDLNLYEQSLKGFSANLPDLLYEF